MKIAKSTKTIFSAVAICIAIVFAHVASVNASNCDVAVDTLIDHQVNMNKIRVISSSNF